MSLWMVWSLCCWCESAQFRLDWVRPSSAFLYPLLLSLGCTSLWRDWISKDKHGLGGTIIIVHRKSEHWRVVSNNQGRWYAKHDNKEHCNTLDVSCRPTTDTAQFSFIFRWNYPIGLQSDRSAANSSDDTSKKTSKTHLQAIFQREETEKCGWHWLLAGQELSATTTTPCFVTLCKRLFLCFSPCCLVFCAESCYLFRFWTEQQTNERKWREKQWAKRSRWKSTTTPKLKRLSRSTVQVCNW